MDMFLSRYITIIRSTNPQIMKALWDNITPMSSVPDEGIVRDSDPDELCVRVEVPVEDLCPPEDQGDRPR